MRDLALLDTLLYDTIVEQEGAAFAAAYREMTESPALLDGASREDAARLIRALTLRFRLCSQPEWSLFQEGRSRLPVRSGM